MTTQHADVSRGMELLNRQGLNKGTAFTDEERTALGLHGLLPPQVESLDGQAARAYEAYKRKDDDLERHIYLRALQDTNQVLFYRLGRRSHRHRRRSGGATGRRRTEDERSRAS